MRSFIYKSLKLVNGSGNSKALRVLAYHDIPDSNYFEAQISYLSANFHLLSIEELKDALFGSKILPANSLLITFDDGDISVYEKGFPILKKMNIPSAMFIITRLIDTQETFWCRWVEKVYEKEGKTYSTARAKVNELKKVPEEERRKYLSGIPKIESVQLTSSQIKTLNSSGMFIGNHTHTHPMINNCNAGQIKEEMAYARSKFQDVGLNDNFSVFAYPNGNWEPDSEKILIEEGIKMAFLFDHQLNENVSKIDPMRISRIRVNADDELSEFKVKVSGLHSKILNLRQKIGV